MDNSNENPLQPEPRKPSRFLGCFGFSSRKKPVVLEKSRSNKRKKKRFISWPAKKSATKTVPVDSANNTVSDEKIVSDKSTLKKKRRCKTVDHKVSSNSKMTRQIPVDKKVASDNQESKHGPQEITSELEEKIITENRDSMNDQIKSPKGTNNTLHKQFCRKIDAIRGGQSQPGSPVTKPKSNRPSSVSRSTSMPIPNHQKPVGNKSSNKFKKTQNDKQEGNGNKFDPVVGMSIIMVTLVIMLFWGRLCAILCTSAWFYFIPRFRTGSDQNVNLIHGSISGEPDFDSEEYKKRVVLEGFLERNHRSVM